MNGKAWFLAAVLCAPTMCPAQTRTWTDNTGQYSVTADLEELRTDEVVLKKADGTLITVPLERFSNADREHLLTISDDDRLRAPNVGKYEAGGCVVVLKRAAVLTEEHGPSQPPPEIGTVFVVQQVEPSRLYVESDMDRGWIDQADVVPLEAAMKHFTEAIAAAPKAPAAYIARGVVQMTIGDYGHAMNDYCKAIDLDSSNSRAYSNRGFLWFRRDAPQRAVQDCDRAIMLDKTNVNAYVYRAMAKSRQGQFTSAAQDLTQAIELGDRRASTRTSRSYCYLVNGQTIAARNDAEYVLTLQRDSAVALTWVGISYISDDVHRALANFRKAVKIHPEFALARYCLGIALEKSGNREEGRHEIAQAIGLDPAIEVAANAYPDWYRDESANHDPAALTDTSFAHVRGILRKRGIMIYNPRRLRRQAIEDAINVPMTYEFVEEPLGEALKQLTEQHQVEVYVDEWALDSANISLDTPITAKAKDTSLEQTLDSILTPLDLMWMVHNDMLFVSDSESEASRLETKVYAFSHQSLDVDSLLTQLKQNITPGEWWDGTFETWEDMAGMGSCFHWPGGAFVVTQTWWAHREINRQFGAVLHPVEPVVFVPATGSASIRSALQEALESVSTCDFQETALCHVLEFLADLHGIDIVVDRNALHNDGLSADIPVTVKVGTIGEVSLESVLGLLLRPFGLMWIIRDDKLVITTFEMAESAAEADVHTLRYDVRDLLTATGGDAKPLLQLIYCTISPYLWEPLGGPDAIRIVPGSGSLMIRQTIHIHRQIEQLLDDLRHIRCIEVAGAAGRN